MNNDVKSLVGKRVFVGLSGGVDSAVSAALLKKAGAEVVGVFIKGWYPPDMPCTWSTDRRDAMRVAAHLRIPFHTLDASAEYKKGVIDYLLVEYRAGRTPNPDIMCNREVKFGAFYAYAKAHGADAIATGHYVQKNDRGHLARATDPGKDQSYFLWAMPHEALTLAVFPLGHMKKTEVRTLAKRLSLPVANKKDSQGICFLGSISVEDFLRSEFGEQSGEIRDTQGTLRGTHNGVLLHTIGERLSLPGGPWYVLSKDLVRNTLIAGTHAEKARGPYQIQFSHDHWFADPSEVSVAQYRYHGPLVSGKIQDSSFVANTLFPELVAPGQSLVFYSNNELIGGGIIEA